MKNSIMDFEINKIPEINSSFIKSVSNSDIAIIGIGAKLPDSGSIDEFWEKLTCGYNFITNIPALRKKDVENYYNFIGEKNFDFEKGAYLNDLDKFDYNFFNISPKEAALMDPNQRLFLETAWNAIEDAGYGGTKIKSSRTGVYVGFSNEMHYKTMVSKVKPSDLYSAVTGNIAPIISSRISYILDLKGPSILINTVCSSSLVSFHLACQAIINNECDMAIAGGIQLHILPIREVEIGIESKDYCTRTFDQSSTGTAGGEGVAAVLLKPLNKAITDKDRIYAVVKGSYINQDGSSVGISAPNPYAQEDVIVRTWKNSNIDPESISYIEAHGTGTKLGDPIEIEGIQRAFKRYTNRKQFCAIGSVKSNIGHLDAAAGIVGLIKAVLSVKNGKIPPSIHFKYPNSRIKFYKSPVYVNDSLSNWPKDKIKRCGVSSFGFSGTNCHVVLEEAPVLKSTLKPKNNDIYFLTISAKSEIALKKLLFEYEKLFYISKDDEFENICYTANTGRGHYIYRIAIIFKNKKDILDKLLYINSNELLNLNIDGIFYGEISTKDIKKANMEQQKSYVKYDEVCIKNILKNYVLGNDYDWEEFYLEYKPDKVKVPTYPFDKKRCWIEIPDIKTRATLNNIFHQIRWVDVEHTSFKVKKDNNILLIKKRHFKCDKFIDSLSINNNKIIIIDIGKSFKEVNKSYFEVGYDGNDLDKLFNRIKDIGINVIIDLNMMECDYDVTDYDLNSKINTDIKWLFNMFKRFYKFFDRKSELIILLKNSISVTGNEKKINPFNMSYVGLALSARHEIHNLDIRCIDVDEYFNQCNIVDDILSMKKYFFVAYRENKRFIQKVFKIKNYETNQTSDGIKSNGVYIITGGLGVIGLEYANHLSKLFKNIKIILIGRSGLNEKSDIINKIKLRGTEIEYIQSDVADYLSLDGTLNYIRNKYGKINGIFHAAGIGARKQGTPIRNEKFSIFEQVMEAKIQGTVLLDKLTRKDNLDFLVLFSSAITLIGGAGSSHYTAANSFLDSYANYRNKEGYRTFTINLAPWNSDGLHDIDEKKHIFKPVNLSEGLSSLDRIVAMTTERIIIGELNTNSELLYLKNFLPFEISDDLLNDSAKSYIENNDNVILKGRESNYYNIIEKNVAQVWKNILGYHEINIKDHFFEIGGDSITIVKAFNMLNEKYPNMLSIADMFSHVTIESLAKYIDEIQSTVNFDMNTENDIEIFLNNIFEDLDKGEITIEDAVKRYNIY